MRFNLFSSTLAVVTIVSTALPAFANPTGWIDADTVRDNPQAFCSDVTGTQTNKTEHNMEQNNNGSYKYDRNQSAEQKKKSGSSTGGSGGFLGIKASAKHGSNSESSQSSQDQQALDTAWNRDYSHNIDQEITRQTSIGKNCDAFVHAAAQVQIEDTRMRGSVETTRVNAERDENITGINAKTAQRGYERDENVAQTSATASVDMRRLETEAEIEAKRLDSDTFRLGLESKERFKLKELESQSQQRMFESILNW